MADMRLGILVTLNDLASGGLTKLGAAVNGLGTTGAARVGALGAAIGGASSKMMAMGAQTGIVGAGMGAALMQPVKAFVELDDAATDLKVTMLDSTGKIGAGFDEIKKQATELGNVLPGTTADFFKVGTALMEQGVQLNTVMNGGLKAASHLAVVLKLPGEAAGTMVAKLREAYGLADNELDYMADRVQRAKFAFGMNAMDLQVASSYMAPSLKTLGIQGKGNMDQILALQGIGAMSSLEGSSFGTNFSMMLTRLAKGPLMLAEAKKGMKKEAQEIMTEMGVTFDFFDDKGKFKGLEAMVKELEKLKTIREKMGDKAALEVSEGLFGAEAGRPAMLIADQGLAGFKAAQERMEKQAALNQRIAVTTQSLSNVWESLTTNVSNAMAIMAEPALEWVKPLLPKLGELVAKFGEFVGKHKELFKWLGLGAAAVAGTLVVFGALAVTLGSIGYVLGGVVSGFGMLLRIFGPIGSVLRYVGTAGMWLGNILRGPLAAGLRMVGTAVLWMGRALLVNPIGLIVTGIAVAAFLVYKNWDWLKVQFGVIWEAIKGYFNSAVAFFQAIPGKMRAIGEAILDGLKQGLMNKWAQVKAFIGEIGASIKSTFTNVLGIQSPSKVFKGYGGYIGEGLALGIQGNQHKAVNAANDMAYAVADAGNVVPFGRGGAGGAGGSIVVHYSPNITVTGGGDVRAQVETATRQSLHEFEQMLDRTLAAKARRRLA